MEAVKTLSFLVCKLEGGSRRESLGRSIARSLFIFSSPTLSPSNRVKPQSSFQLFVPASQFLWLSGVTRKSPSERQDGTISNRRSTLRIFFLIVSVYIRCRKIPKSCSTSLKQSYCRIRRLESSGAQSQQQERQFLNFFLLFFLILPARGPLSP